MAKDLGYTLTQDKDATPKFGKFDDKRFTFKGTVLMCWRWSDLPLDKHTAPKTSTFLAVPSTCGMTQIMLNASFYVLPDMSKSPVQPGPSTSLTAPQSDQSPPRPSQRSNSPPENIRSLPAESNLSLKGFSVDRTNKGIIDGFGEFYGEGSDE